ncbi:MAG: ABC transporter permease [Dethiobacter sp.]|jgi:peptide/nickel transport system permease protein|nr:MAG: ABC transporter permease [Dethiobacter sp.]
MRGVLTGDRYVWQKKRLNRTFSALKENKLAAVGLIIISVLVLMAVFAPLITLRDPYEQNLEIRLTGSNEKYLMGTDQFGRCLFSRLIYGIRISLTTGVISAVLTMGIGVFTGLLAGYFGGIMDELIMRITDIVLSFPSIVLTLVIAGVLGPDLKNIIIALAAVGWTKYARVVRGSVLSIKEQEYVESAKALGASDIYLLCRHILPNCMGPVIVIMTLSIGGAILSIAGLSFLGLGAQPPTPEWGMMLNQGVPFMRRAPHLTIFPGLAIMITVLAFNFLGDGLRDIMDPRLKSKLFQKF